MELGLVGVSKKHQNSGVAWIIFEEMMEILNKDKNIRFFETNLNLESNLEIINSWNRFNSRQHKRRRCYILKLDD